MRDLKLTDLLALCLQRRVAMECNTLAKQRLSKMHARIKAASADAEGLVKAEQQRRAAAVAALDAKIADVRQHIKDHADLAK